MAVRNFYLEADIDGRKTDLSGGPASRTGGMSVHLHQRNDGGIESDVVRIYCYEDDGELITRVTADGKEVFRYTTKR